jgi:glycine cleavage system H protein
MTYPAELRYTKDHEWARIEGDIVRVGVTSYAVDQLGDVTLVDLPDVGTNVTAHDRFGEIESVKTVSELFSPVSGEITAVNEELEGNPEQVNEAPYGAGWLVDIKVSDPAELEALMDANAYADYIGKLEG